MRVLLCGYHEAGYRALRILVARGHEVVVATHPAPPGLPSVADYARMLGIAHTAGPIEEVVDLCESFSPQIVFSVYYRSILPASLLQEAVEGAFNFHPSLLPRHAGCFSGVWAILEGDRSTGVTCHRMTDKIDGGDIVDTMSFEIEANETGMSLYYKLTDTAVDLFARVLRRTEIERLTGHPQRGDRSYRGREVPFGGVLDSSWSRDRVDRFIRALDFPPYPPACVWIDGVRHEVRSLEDYDRLAASRGVADSSGPVAAPHRPDMARACTTPKR